MLVITDLVVFWFAGMQFEDTQIAVFTCSQDVC